MKALIREEYKINNEVYNMWETIRELVKTSAHQKNTELSVLVDHLRLTVLPPIKGKLTNKKLANRDVVLIKENGKYWLEQRGRRLTPKITS